MKKSDEQFKVAVEAMKQTVIGYLVKYPDELRDQIMSARDKADCNAAGLFVVEVSKIEDEDPEVLAGAINAYMEVVWMLGYEKGRQASNGQGRRRN